MKVVSSEVSGNFLARLLTACRLFRVELNERAKGWDRQAKDGRDVWDAETMTQELEAPLSKGKIRHKSRTEILPELYLTTVFFSPEVVSSHIEVAADDVVKECLDAEVIDRLIEARDKAKLPEAKNLFEHLTWLQKDALFGKKLGYDTEMTDGNNVEDRLWVNRLLIKNQIVKKAMLEADPKKFVSE